MGYTLASAAPDEPDLAMRRVITAISLFLALEAGIIAGIAFHGTVVQWNAIHRTSGAEQHATAASPRDGAVLSIEGTDIVEPVVQATEAEGNSFYLKHDVNGLASPTGAIFADYRCTQPTQHLLLYGHSFAYGTDKFTELKKAWKTDRFASIGSATISIDGHAASYRPIAAMKVDAGYAEIQRFGFSDTAELRAWLQVMVDAADVRAEKSADEIARAQRALTMVTCSDVKPNQPGRTVIVFASANPERILPLPRRS